MKLNEAEKTLTFFQKIIILIFEEGSLKNKNFLHLSKKVLSTFRNDC